MRTDRKPSVHRKPLVPRTSEELEAIAENRQAQRKANAAYAATQWLNTRFPEWRRIDDLYQPLSPKDRFNLLQGLFETHARSYRFKEMR